MRIFLSCQQALQKHNVPTYSFWETYFKNGIEEAQHEWLEANEVDWAEGLVYLNEDDLEKWRDRTWSLKILGNPTSNRYEWAKTCLQILSMV